jgi:ribonuclease D
MCTAMKIQYVNFFETFEIGLAQICADFLEIRIDKKKIK